MTILIADSGSTKTEWLLEENSKPILRFTTSGMNPALQSAEEISNTLKEEVQPQLLPYTIHQIRFYGAGCSGLRCNIMQQILESEFKGCPTIVNSDLLGAAHSLCKDKEGIACILGTGANSCLFDGNKIIQNIPSLGYILGDEGSGSSLGKRLIGDIYKERAPKTIYQSFHEEYQLSIDSLIENVYRRPFPNRYLASFTHFLSKHRNQDYVQTVLQEEFSKFFLRNISTYKRLDLPVHFVGSIAYHFKDELEKAGKEIGFKIGIIKKSPLE